MREAIITDVCSVIKGVPNLAAVQLWYQSLPVLLSNNIATLSFAVLLQGFRSAEEVQRFSDMMEEMCYIVATKHSGSLKVRFCTSHVPLCCKSLCCAILFILLPDSPK